MQPTEVVRCRWCRFFVHFVECNLHNIECHRKGNRTPSPPTKKKKKEKGGGGTGHNFFLMRSGKKLSGNWYLYWSVHCHYLCPTLAKREQSYLGARSWDLTGKYMTCGHIINSVCLTWTHLWRFCCILSGLSPFWLTNAAQVTLAYFDWSHVHPFTSIFLKWSLFYSGTPNLIAP